ncbi:hypothetical protein LTS01_024191 [Friedmanniomyces endolithicus]|nr:hypothetical protein LTS01_024191 [Friedmanniomyces endolithicus]
MPSPPSLPPPPPPAAGAAKGKGRSEAKLSDLECTATAPSPAIGLPVEGPPFASTLVKNPTSVFALTAAFGANTTPCVHVRSRDHSKIAVKDFKEGDLALFLPTRGQARGAWAAFNVNCPHFFLAEREGMRLGTRDFIVARIAGVEMKVVDLSRGAVGRAKAGLVEEVGEGGLAVREVEEDDNPFDLSDGLTWWMVHATEERGAGGGAGGGGAPTTPGLGKVWEQSFTAFLGDNRESMTNIDIKRAMVLKANHLVGTMLASVDQSAGPIAYDPYETEFKAIVDLSREVLATFSCPPLPTLSGGATGAPYLSFSLWVTDPLWMAISRCRNPSIRQAAFTLLSQNPRQEGIWHGGPQLSNNRHARRTETQSRTKETVKESAPPKEPPAANRYDSESEDGDDDDTAGVGVVEPEYPVPNGCNTAHSDAQNGTCNLDEDTGDPKARHEWVDLRAQVHQWTKRT